MKTFIFTIECKKSTYGTNIINKVYRVKNNIPELLGETKYNTGSMRGHIHEAFCFLKDNKYITKQKDNYYRWNGNYNFQIIEL